MRKGLAVLGAVAFLFLLLPASQSLPGGAGLPVPDPAVDLAPTGAEHMFGFGVAIDGDVAVVGSDSDSAYVYRRDGADWALEARLAPPPEGGYKAFGAYVEVQGDTIVVTAMHENTAAGVESGAVYVYTHDVTGWTLQQRILPADAQALDGFGYFVSLDGDRMMVGATGVDLGDAWNAGAAYVYSRVGTTWELEARLVAPDPIVSGDFGRAVALSGDVALVGAPAAYTGRPDVAGSAHLFRKIDGAWTFEAKFEDPSAQPWAQFGLAVALEGDVTVVGAPETTEKILGQDPFCTEPVPSVPESTVCVNTLTFQGAAYVYERGEEGWEFVEELSSPVWDGAGRFGRWAAVDDGRILVSDPFRMIGIGFQFGDAVKSSTGTAYLFERRADGWALVDEILPGPGMNESGWVGWSLDLSGPWALLGAPAAADMEGRAYLVDVEAIALP